MLEDIAANPTAQCPHRVNASSPDPDLQVEILVDLTLSMKPFADYQAQVQGQPAPSLLGGKGKAKLATPLPAKAIEPSVAAAYKNSDYLALLKGLGGQAAVQSWQGWGSPKNGGQGVVPLHGPPTDPSQYSLANNDYAALINALPRPPHGTGGTVHLIISDGVESHAERTSGSTLGPTGKAIQSWLAQGGAVELRLFHAPYYGTYYSESNRPAKAAPGESTPSVRYETLERPFLVLALLDSPAALSGWQKLWSKTTLAPLKPIAEVVTVPLPGEKSRYEAKPLVSAPASEVQSLALLSPTIWKVSPLDLAQEWTGIYTAKVQPKFSRKAIDLPLYFEVKRPAAAQPEEPLNAKGLKPQLTIYELKAPPVAGEKGAPEKSAAKSPPTKWTPLSAGPYFEQEPGLVVSPGAPLRKGTPPAAAASSVVFRWFVPGHPTHPLLCYFTVKAPTAALKEPDFSSWNTLDDANPNNAGQTYQLQTLIEQIVGFNPPRKEAESGCAVYVY